MQQLLQSKKTSFLDVFKPEQAKTTQATVVHSLMLSGKRAAVVWATLYNLVLFSISIITSVPPPMVSPSALGSLPCSLSHSPFSLTCNPRSWEVPATRTVWSLLPSFVHRTAPVCFFFFPAGTGRDDKGGFTFRLVLQSNHSCLCEWRWEMLIPLYQETWGHVYVGTEKSECGQSVGRAQQRFTMLMFPMLSLLGQVATLLSRSSNVSRKH